MAEDKTKDIKDQEAPVEAEPAVANDAQAPVAEGAAAARGTFYAVLVYHSKTYVGVKEGAVPEPIGTLANKELRELRKRLRELCSLCKAQNGSGGAERKLPCTDACPGGAIRHSW